MRNVTPCSPQWQEVENLRESISALRRMAQRWGGEFPMAAGVAAHEADLDEARLRALTDRYPQFATEWSFQ